MLGELNVRLVEQRVRVYCKAVSELRLLLMTQSAYDNLSLLQLYHWVKCLKDNAGNIKPADTGEYQFAKYNKKV